MFCQKCGSILIPKKEGKRTVMACKCGFKEKEAAPTLKESVGSKKKIEVIEKESLETLPLTEEKCPDCGHKRAYYWTVQTRAADEAATKFFKCEKCRHTWREYD